MRTLVALGGATAVSLIALSAANAQDCVNGYRTLGNGMILTCQDMTATLPATEAGVAVSAGAVGSVEGTPMGAPPVEFREDAAVSAGIVAEPIVVEPVYTGSVAAAPTGGPPVEFRENRNTGNVDVAMAAEGFAEPVVPAPVVVAPTAAPGSALPLEYRENRDTGNPDVAASVSLEAEGPWACQPGQFWMRGNIPMMCR